MVKEEKQWTERRVKEQNEAERRGILQVTLI